MGLRHARFARGSSGIIEWFWPLNLLKSVKLTPPDDRTSENVLAKLVSNNNPSQLAYKAFINKKHTLPIKSKQNGKEIVNSKMRRISTGGPFIYYLEMYFKHETQKLPVKFLHRKIATNVF